LILRAITSIVLIRIYNDRNDRFGSYHIERPFSSGTGIRDAFTGGLGGGRTGGYEDLDGPTSVVSGTSPAGGNGPSPSSHNQSTNVPYQSVPSPIHAPLIDTK